MAKTKEVELEEPIDGPKGPIVSVLLREPTVRECLRNGDPFTVGETQGKVKFISENGEAIEAYLKECIVEPDPLLVLSAGGARLVGRLKEALFSFFLHADAARQDSDAVSKTSSTNSSSAASADTITLV